MSISDILLISGNIEAHTIASHVVNHGKQSSIGFVMIFFL